MVSTSCPQSHLQDPEILAWITGGSFPESMRAHVDGCGACRLRIDRKRAEISELRRIAAGLPEASADQAAGLSAEPDAGGAIPRAGESEESLDDSEVDALAASDEHQAQPDSIGRYRIVGKLNSGGQALVYRAIHPTLPRDLAIKIAHKPSPIDHSLLKADAELLSELDHPNLVRVHDLDTHEGRPFVVMEFLRGRNLQELAEQALPSPRHAAEWVAAIARALEYVHRQGVVHQDIKPKNIMLDESGCPRLIDFGMARWRHVWSRKRAGPSGGTLAFMAPEQARGETERIGAPSDIFALGGVLYFLLTGKSPFGGGTDGERWSRACQCDFDRTALKAKHVPRGLERVVLKAMATQPEDRYPSAGAMADALDAFLNRRRLLTRLVGTLLVGVLAVAGYLLWSRPAREVNPVPVPVPGRSLKVDSFHVELHPVKPDDPVGLIGIDTFSARFGQDVRIQAQLNMPAYCYLVALNPNGKDQLCYPKDPRIAPGSVATIDYPSDPGKGFGLTDGVGTQAFVLIASTKRLPSYADWSRSLGDLPWERAETETVWRYDGRNFEREMKRGDVRPLADLPPPLEAACRAFQNHTGVEAIRALAFPVSAGPAARGENH
jgi:serine/threonine protein kinase